jgi:hypothetical protein
MKLGRLPRAFEPRIPHMSALLPGRKATLAPIPISIDYADVLPADLGVMCNNLVGDCTCAAAGHLRQIWTRYANGVESTMPDDAILRMYAEVSGFDGVPGDATDRGAVEQDVLTYWLNSGVPLDSNGTQRNKLTAFVEIDPRNFDDLCRAIYECGGAYLGIQVPAWLMAGAIPAVWDTGSDTSIEGGHAIAARGYDQTARTVKIVSWGTRYDITERFMQTYLDEAYALCDQDWIEKTGLSPLGMSLSALEAQMEALKHDAN